MRILVISNFYPPYYIGGYELGCQAVVVGLKARGHDVKVLTSTYGVGKRECDGEIYRWLQADLGWKTQGLVGLAKLFRKEVNNQIAFRRLCSILCPDVVYAWKLEYISVSVALTAIRTGYPVFYFVSDNWLSRWESESWYSLWSRQARRATSRFCKKLLSLLLRLSGLLSPSISLDLRHVQFASRYLEQFALQAGKLVTNPTIIHWGIDTNRFPYREVSHNPKRLLYVGQIIPQKGVHTAVEALKMIVQQHGYESITLTIVGGSITPDYRVYVGHLVSSFGLENNVHFAGLVSRESLPSVYREHDILVFPSVWDEPFSITLLEGMSSGLAVVGTATGGSREILEDNVNALVFPKEDAKACSSQILRLMNDLELFERIRQSGTRTIEERFRFENMMDKIEESLQSVVT